ncbi:hypothetical protein H072_10595 [Dactylellina haptotyla CBS 200.50]|uniref:DUF3824 domain-containing protein n=1 Tax=Dactylellina haptotyla (strain CBS 200.50) TaxID=1284197 RepID=S7ZYZ7_DACHA|nr:hypothetical protein H072_10595 [Dactylellina haptotyla CBS 200.50]
MSTTQEDYFGNAINPGEQAHRQKHRRHKHKSRSYTPSDSDSDHVVPREVVHEEREYKKPSRRHRYRETVDTTVYEPAMTDTDTDGASTDDGKRRRRKHRHRRRERIPDDASSTVAEAESGTDGDEPESIRSSSSKGKMRERAKSMGESAMAALGLEDTYKRARSRSKSRGRKPSSESDEGYDSNGEKIRSRSTSRMHSNTAQAAMIAAAVEAFRARKEPGGVTGSKSLKRVVEAAVASGAVEKFLDRKGEDDKKSNKRIAESVIAGLAAQRGLNGRRSKRRDDGDEKANPIRDIAASGLIAAAGKKFLDYQRSRSQSRGRDRSEDGSPERPGFHRRRSRSMGEALAAMGLGGLAAERFGRTRHDSRSSRGSRKSIQDGSSSDSSMSDSDLSLDEEAERERHKRLRRKEIISVALAILATLHLGHVGYEAREKRMVRKEKLESGRITEEESDKLRNKSVLKDATAVGLAIFAAAEAVKAFKGMQEKRHEFREFESKRPQIEEHRRRKAIQQNPHDEPPRGEASKYYSQPGYMGPPPGASVPGGYPYYPTSGPIPNTYGREAYNTRDGRDIPVVYPNSVTHA